MWMYSDRRKKIKQALKDGENEKKGGEIDGQKANIKEKEN